MPAIDTYSAGTVTLTNGSAVVTGAAVNWISGGKYNVFGGHWFRYGTFVSLILNVDSATQITLATPFPGTTVAGAAYQIFRYTRLETPEAVGLLQSVLDRGSAASPFGRFDIDSGALRASFRDDGAGNLGWYVGGSGAPDGSQIKAATLNKTTGALTFERDVSVGSKGAAREVAIGMVNTVARLRERNYQDQFTITTNMSYSNVQDDVTKSSWQMIMGHAAGQDCFDLARAAPGGGFVSFLHADSSGKIGIGTASPAYPVDIQSGAVPLRVLSSGQDAVTRYECTGTGGRVFHAGSTGSLSGAGNGFGIYDVTASALRTLIDGSGNFGIGAASAGARLQVTGPDSPTAVLVQGATKALRIGSYSTGMNIESVDSSGVGSFQPLIIGGTIVSITAPLVPGSSNTYTLGNSGATWKDIFLNNNPTVTSDAREKTAVRALTEAEISASRDLLAEIGIYQWLAAIAEKGEGGARLHVGMTVQRAIEIMEGHGLDPWRYGLICRDDITRKVVALQIQSVPVTELIEEVYPEIEIRDGVPVQVMKTRAVDRPVTVMTPVIGEDGQPVTRRVQATEDIVEPVTEIVLQAGQPVQISQPQTVKKPLFEMRPLLDEAGQPVTRIEPFIAESGFPDERAVPVLHPVPVMIDEPVMHAVPVTEEREVEVEIEEPAGDRLGFRYDQLKLFIMCGIAARLDALEA